MNKNAPIIINRFFIVFYALVVGIGFESSLLARGGEFHGGGARHEGGGYRPENNRYNEEHRNNNHSYENRGHMNYQQRENAEKLNDYRAGYNQGVNEGEEAGASVILPDEIDDADQDYNNLLFDANDPNNPNNNQNSNQGQ